MISILHCQTTRSGNVLIELNSSPSLCQRRYSRQHCQAHSFILRLLLQQEIRARRQPLQGEIPLRRFRCQFYPSQTQCTATAPAVHCNRLCSALHPSLQCTASSTLIHAFFPASTCNRPCKYLRSPQSIVSFPASVCLFWHKRYPSPDFVHPIPTCRYAPLLCSYDSKIFLLCIRIFLWPWSFLQDAPFLPIIYNARFVKKM